MIGDRIKFLRLKFGYSQKELANLIKVSHQTVSKYEKGINQPDAQKLTEISKVLNCTVDYLVGISDTPEKEETVIYKNNNNDAAAVVIDTPPLTAETVDKVINLLIQYKFDKTKLIKDIEDGIIENVDLR